MRARAKVWFTSEDAREYRLSRQADLAVTQETPGAPITVRLDPERRHQTILGMGSSLARPASTILCAWIPKCGIGSCAIWCILPRVSAGT